MRYAFAIIIAYLLGNIAPSYFIGKKMRNIDIREHGSGNAGATNTLRVLGARPGIFVFIVDVLKGILAAIIGKAIGGEIGAVLAGCAVIIGHDYPVLLEFQGGKGVATSIGVMSYLAPWVVLSVAIIGVIIINISKYVSLASICGMIISPLLVILFKYPKEYRFLALFIAILGTYRHSSNIKRLLNGTENKVNISNIKFF